jgi:hypothetical protein
MKKLLIVFALILALSGVVCWAASSTQNLVWVRSSEKQTDMATLTVEWVGASSASGGVTATLFPHIRDSLKGSYLVVVVTKPSATAVPTAYDLTLVDEYGIDALGGVGAGRSATLTQQVTPYVGALYGPRPVSGDIALTISSTGSGGSGTTILYFSRQR